MGRKRRRSSERYRTIQILEDDTDVYMVLPRRPHEPADEPDTVLQVTGIDEPDLIAIN